MTSRDPVKGQTRDPSTLRAQYLENGWRFRSKEVPIGNGIMGYQLVTWPMTSRDHQRCCEAVRSATPAIAWLLVTGDGPMWNCSCVQLWRDSRLTWSDSDVVNSETVLVYYRAGVMNVWVGILKTSVMWTHCVSALIASGRQTFDFITSQSVGIMLAFLLFLVVLLSPPPPFITSFVLQENKHLLHGIELVKNFHECTRTISTLTFPHTHPMCLGGAAVRASDFWHRGHGFDSRSGRYQAPRLTQPPIPQW